MQIDVNVLMIEMMIVKLVYVSKHKPCILIIILYLYYYINCACVITRPWKVHLKYRRVTN